MAQRWAIGALSCAVLSPIYAFRNQNQLAHFLWPQIPPSETPYPDGVFFSDYNVRPESNHSMWGVLMFPVAGFTSYYIFKYSIGSILKLFVRTRYRLSTAPINTPQYLSINRTLQVRAPSIVQKATALTCAVPFALGAKVWRDGPGDRWDPEFYRSGYVDSSWDFVNYIDRTDRSYLVENPINFIADMNKHTNPDSQFDFPLNHEHPHTEVLDTETGKTWFNTSLGYDIGAMRRQRDKWAKMRVFAKEKLEWFEDTNLLEFETADQGKLKSKYRYDPDKFAIDPQTPLGQLPNFGASDSDGLRLPYVTSEGAGQSEFVTKGGGMISQEEFFNQNTKARERWENEDEDLTAKFRELITGNAKSDKSSIGLDPYSLEQRRTAAAAKLFAERGHVDVDPRDFNPYQAFYFHPDSVVGRDIPLNAKIASHATHVPFTTEPDEDIPVKEWEPHHYLDQEHTAPWSTHKPENTFKNITENDRRQRLAEMHQIPLTLDKLTEEYQSVESIAARVESIEAKNDPEMRVIPGYGPIKEGQYLGRVKAFLNDYLREGFTYDRLDWIPNYQKGIIEHRHDYYSGRGRIYADEPNFVTGLPAYDPNHVPAPPLPHGTRQILDVESYYAAAERVDQEHAKRVAGSFKKLYGNPFPKFEDPLLYDDATVKRYPHLEKVNKRLELQTKYFNSLEERVLATPPPTNAAREQSTLSKTLHEQIPKNWEEAKEQFQPLLYRTSTEYRRLWSEKFPALKAYGEFPTAEQIEYVLDFSPKYDKRKPLKSRALPKSHLTDRAVREAVELDMSYLTDPSRTFGVYEPNSEATKRRELYPRDLLISDELHYGHQPISQQKGHIVNVGMRDQEADYDIQ